MLKNRKFWAVLLPLVFGGFVLGVVQLFKLRFDRGDMYPPCSTLRADPLGTKVFYESLAALPSVSVARLYEPLHKVKSSSDTTLFVLGTEPWELKRVAEQEVKDIERFLFDGGRLVISFRPVSGKTWPMRMREKLDKKQKKDAADEPNKKKKQEKYDEDERLHWVSLEEKWGLKCSFAELALDENGIALPESVRQSANSNLPSQISWHTALYFDELDVAWDKIYLRDTNAVVIARSFGKGSVVLSADSYPFSNEAMRKEREPALLAWLAGDSHRILFDETHLGVAADPGIAALARKYRLHGLIAGLVLLAALFVWKNSFSFVPPQEDLLESDATIAGKDSATGFVNLLRRSVSPVEILSVCVEEWKRSATHRHDKKLARVESVVREENSRPPRERNPIKAYQAVSTILTERK